MVSTGSVHETESIPLTEYPDIFRSASRLETFGKHSQGGRRDGGLKILCNKARLAWGRIEV